MLSRRLVHAEAILTICCDAVGVNDTVAAHEYARAGIVLHRVVADGPVNLSKAIRGAAKAKPFWIGDIKITDKRRVNRPGQARRRFFSSGLKPGVIGLGVPLIEIHPIAKAHPKPGFPLKIDLRKIERSLAISMKRFRVTASQSA